MTLDSVFFYAFALMAVLGAGGTVLSRSAVHGAISLIVSLLGVAGLYLTLQAEFLFAIQIILYVGGVMVLFLFVIMLVNLDEASRERQFSRQWLLALACGLGIGAELLYLLVRGLPSLPPPAPPQAAAGNTLTGALGNTERLADVLFAEYLVPFEVASVLLLVAVVGSVVMAKRNLDGGKEAS